MPAEILTVERTPDGQTSADHVEVTEWQRGDIGSIMEKNHSKPGTGQRSLMSEMRKSKIEALSVNAS